MQTLMCSFQWIDVADHVSDCHIRCGKLFTVAFGAVDPLDRCLISHFPNKLNGMIREGGKWIIIDLRALDNWSPFVQKLDQRASNTCLCLSTKSEQNDIVTSKNGISKLRNDRIFVTKNPWKDRFAPAEFL